MSERGVVLEGTGGVWRVRTTDGETREASMRGRLKKADGGRRADGSRRRDTVRAGMATVKLAVGDEVLLEPGDDAGAWAIAEILPRRSRLARRAPGGAYGERVVVANLDQVVVVFAAAQPEPHAGMIDRFLVIAEANGLHARLVVNKVELVGEAAARARFAAYERLYPVHYTSVKEGQGLDALRDALGGRVSALSGPSGVGKSSLINALYPGLRLRVGEISQSVNKGRHTTVGALLTPLPGGAGFVADTPGLREVGLWGLPSAELDQLFPEFRPFLDDCRFADCTHRQEPDCGVRTAVDEGDVSPERYESYRKLRSELEELETEVW
jgi:ribosome biogenesis GTPase